MAKPDLILLHGALGAQSQFDPWADRLGEHFKLHRPEFEGHGAQSFADRPFRIEAFADNLAAFMAERSLVGVPVFGYSMGGYVALYESSRHPEAFSRILTFATKFDWNPASAQKESAMLDPEAIRDKVPHFAESLRKRHHGNDWVEHLHRTGEMMRDLGEQPRLGPQELAKVSVPCLIGVGTKDRMVSENETRWAQEHLPQATFLHLEETRHPIEKIDLELLLPHMLDFFEKN